MRSRYDDLHDKYTSLLTSKAGTRYERLSAIVFKVLNGNNVVVHDVRLLGDSEVSHQIDVRIEIDGRARRVILECKDFDLSGRKVGLDVVRNFWAVADDTKPDDAIVLTCTGFTSQAAKYAKAKGMKLAVMRAFEEADWEGRFRCINVTLIALVNTNHQVSINVSGEGEKAKLDAAMKTLAGPNVSRLDPMYVVRGTERVSIVQFVDAGLRRPVERKTLPSGKEVFEIKSDGWQIEITGYPPVDFASLYASFNTHQVPTEFAVESKRIAELIVSGISGADIIIFGDQLERRQIDPDSGEVI
jgi:hypothetical protein